MLAWTPIVAVAVAVALAAVNGLDPAADPAPALAGSGAPTVTLLPPAETEDEQMLVIAPEGSYDLAIRSNGAPLEVIVRLHDGASLGGSLSGPGLCRQGPFSTNVIALSTSGQVVLYGECGTVAAGDHVLHIDGGSSAFLARVQVRNATFVAS